MRCVAHAKTCQAIRHFDWAQAHGVSLSGEACVGPLEHWVRAGGTGWNFALLLPWE